MRRRAMRGRCLAPALGAALLALVAASCAPGIGEDRVALKPVSYSDLPGWNKDDPAAALAALRRSCANIVSRPDGVGVGPDDLAGRVRDWRGPCRSLLDDPSIGSDADGARAFLERHFRPFAVIGSEGEEGLFTGYFEYELRGSRHRSKRYHVPLYRRPPDLVSVDLGAFSDDWRGRSIAGRVENGRLVPYADRAAIGDGALAGRGLELLWVEDPVDAFFLQIQGSGRVRLDDGSVVRVGYAGKNGHAYTSIGKLLVEMGAFPRDGASMQRIRAWLAAHPDRAREILDSNRSFVFFREIPGEGPIGAEGVPLTPERSVAVDRKYLPLGLPLYVAADDPTGRQPPVRRLMVAQDTGGAIVGPVRGDLFMGTGREAGARAGRTKMRGRWWALIPTDAARQVAGRW